jgi:LEA14-like dessication related protein
MFRLKKIVNFLLVLSVVYFTSCKSFKETEFTGVKNFKINKVDMSGIDADIKLGIKNPNTIGFSIYPSTFDVIYAGVNLGKAHSTKRIYINAKSENVYTFRLKSDLKNVTMMDVMRLVNVGGKGIIEVKGDIKAGKFYLKKKFPVNVKERVEL